MMFKEQLKERLTDWSGASTFFCFIVLLSSIVFLVPLLIVGELRWQAALKLLFYVPCAYLCLWHLRKIDRMYKAKRK